MSIRGRERWKAIKGYPGYFISDYGRIKSIKSRGPKILKGSHSYYLSAALSFKGIAKTHRHHRLVAIYFIKNPKNKPEVNHKDGNKLNNHYKNLEWVTAKENSRHRTEVLDKRNSKYTKEQVLLVRKLALDLRNKDICSLMGMHKSTISKMINRTYWSHI